MSLADAIRALRGRVLADLITAHDYYIDTRTAWDIVHQFVAAGNTFNVQNTATGTVTTQADLAGKAQKYVTEQLAEATFQQFIATFENFFFDLLRLWLRTYPRSLSGRMVDFKAVLDAADKDAVILLVVNKELNELLYEQPAEWFAYLEGRAKLGCPTTDEIDRIAEAKASRDVLTHGRGVANKTYESKAGKLARYKDGEPIDIPEPYHRATWELIRKVVSDVSDAAVAKAT
jgi:hypothetical protein